MRETVRIRGNAEEWNSRPYNFKLAFCGISQGVIIQRAASSFRCSDSFSQPLLEPVPRGIKDEMKPEHHALSPSYHNAALPSPTTVRRSTFPLMVVPRSKTYFFRVATIIGTLNLPYRNSYHRRSSFHLLNLSEHMAQTYPSKFL